jgi:hypothetical protein
MEFEIDFARDGDSPELDKLNAHIRCFAAVGVRARREAMNVLAVSTPGQPEWRWRIVNYHGETVEESYSVFPTIGAAVAEGNERLRRHADRDAPIVHRTWRHGR